MPTITPTFTLTANKNSHTTPGPLSVALSVSATDALLVDNVESEIFTLSTTPAQLLDGSALSAGTETPTTSSASGVGGYIYLKNTGTAKVAYVGIVSNVIENDGSTVLGNDAPTAPASDSSAGHLAEAANTTLRTMSLAPGEFAWFPWDYTGDLYAECEHSDGTTLEMWRFDRSAT